MAPEVVGTAYVRIRAITTKLASDIKDGIDRGASDSGPDVQKSGAGIGRTLGEGITDGMKQTVSDGIGNSISDALTDDKKTRKTGSGLGRKIGKDTAIGFFESFSSNFTKSFKATNVFANAFKKLGDIKFTGLTTLVTAAIPVLIGALKTAAYYVVGLIAQIGFLVEASAGAGAALGGLFVGVVPALGVVMAAFKTQTPQLEKFKENLKKVGEEWKKVGEAAQKSLLPALEGTAEILTRKLLPDTEAYAKSIGKITGTYTTWIAAVLSTERSQTSFSAILEASREIWDNIMRAVVSLVEILLPLGNAMVGVGAQFSETLGNMALDWKDTILTMSDDGSLEQTFQNWYDKAKIVFGGLADLVIGVWAALKVGADEAAPSFDTFRNFAAEFRAWAESKEGQTKLHDFFGTALEVMREVNKLFGEIMSLIFTPLFEGDNDNIVSTLEGLRTTVLPAIVNLITTITDNIDAGTLNAFMLAFVDLIDALQSSGVMNVSLVVVTDSMKILTEVMQSDIGPFVGDFLGFVWGLSVIAKIPGVGLILGQVADGLLALTGAMLGIEGAVTVGSVLTAIAGGISNFIAAIGLGAETGIIGGAGGGLLESLGMGIGAIASSIAAVGVGTLAVIASVILAIVGAVTAAYFIFPKAREVVDELWDSFTRLRDAIGGIFTGDEDIKTRLTEAAKALGDFMLRLATLPTDFAVGIGKSIIDGVKDLVPKLGETIGGWVDVVEEKIHDLADAFTGWVTDAKDKVGEKLGEIGTAIKEWITGLPGAITGFLASLGEGTGSAAGALLGWIDTAINNVLFKLGEIVGHIIGWFIVLPDRIREAYGTAKEAIVEWITQTIPDMIVKLDSWYDSFRNWIADFVTVKIPEGFLGAVESFTGWIGNLWATAQVKFDEFKASVGAWIDEWILGMPEKLGGMVDKFEEAFKGLASGLWNGVTAASGWMWDLVQGFWDWIIQFGKEIPEHLGAIVEAFENLGGDILGGMLDGLKAAAKKVTGWFGSFLGGVFKGAQDEVDAHSPSRLYMTLGHDIMNGLAIGLEQGVPAVEKAMESVKKSIGVGSNDIGATFNADISAVGAEFGKIHPGAVSNTVTFDVAVTASGNLTDDEAQKLGENIVVGAQREMSRTDLAAKVAMA